MQAVLTSDSPALVGSTITFAVNLVFPRCQKEDASGNWQSHPRKASRRLLFKKNVTLLQLTYSVVFISAV